MRDPSELASAYFDDQLSDGELAALQQWMAVDADHLRQFVRESLVHSRIRDLLQQRDMCGLAFDEVDGVIDPDRIVSLLDEEAASERRRATAAEAEALRATQAAARRLELEFDRSSLRVEPPRAPWRWYAGAAIAASLLFVSAQWMLSDPPLAPHEKSGIAAAPAAPPVVGKIAKSLAAHWDDPELPVAVGSPLRAGSVVLKSGVLEIEFDTGAKVVIEAPAALQLVSTDRARLERGRVVVHVPDQALGFTLLSKAASFVDLGTEFGVEVSDVGEASVQVLDGEVALVRGGPKNSEPSMMMQVNDAHLVSADGSQVETIPFDRSHFIRRVPASEYELTVLKSRPLFYWRLSESDQGVVESNGRLPARGVVAHGLQWGDGIHGDVGSGVRMWPGHGGIDLGIVSDLNLRTNFTCEAWVRSKPNPAGGTPLPPQRVLSTFDRSPARTGFAFGLVGAPWYQLAGEGVLAHFTVHGVYDCISTISVPEDQWLHLATVVDECGEPTLFMNGEPVGKRYRQQHDARDSDDSPENWISAKDWDRQHLGTPSGGPARLGKHPIGSARLNAIEEFQGWLSDVAVYDRALPAEEILRHYHAVMRQPESATP